MALLDLLHDLAARNIKLWLEGNQLKFKAPKGALTKELRERLVASKPEVIAHLSKNLQVRQAEAAIPRAARDQNIPLSSAQRGVWFFEQNHPGTATYHISFARTVTGPLQREALEAAFADMVRRHESLRTRFPKQDGEPYQHIEESGKASLGFANLTAVPEDRQADMAREWVTKLATQPFDLEEGPLVRLALARLAEAQYLLVFVIHHLIADGWSMEIFLREWAACYAARLVGSGPDLEPLPIQFADFALWQQQLMKAGEWDKQMAYWKDTLAGPIPHSGLPIKDQRPSTLSSRGELVYFEVDPAVFAVLRKYREADGATPFMTFFAAFAVLLHRFSSQEDWWIGTPVAQRDRHELEKLIGFLVNTLVLRTDLGDQPTFASLHRRIQKTCLQAFAHADVPFESLVEMLQPERDPSRNPLVQVMFSYHISQPGGFQLEGVTLEPFDYQVNVAHFDLTFGLENQGDQLLGFVEYNSDLFTQDFMQRFTTGYQHLLAGIAADPHRPISDYDLMDQEAALALRTQGWWTQAESEEGPFWQEWLDRVSRFGESDTGKKGGGNAFAQQVQNFANGLRSQGFKSGQCLGVALPVSLSAGALYAALLGLGIDVVPLLENPDPERLDALIQNHGLQAVVAAKVWDPLTVPVLTKETLLGVGEDTCTLSGAGRLLMPRTDGLGGLEVLEMASKPLENSLQMLQETFAEAETAIVSLLRETHPLWVMSCLAAMGSGKTWQAHALTPGSDLSAIGEAWVLATPEQIHGLHSDLAEFALKVWLVADSADLASCELPALKSQSQLLGMLYWEPPVGVIGQMALDATGYFYPKVTLPRKSTLPVGIMDSHGRPLPQGGEGEIWLLQNSAPAEVDPLQAPSMAEAHGIPTGARGKFNDCGDLCILGRIDGWRCLGGSWVQLSRVVALLKDHEHVADASFALAWNHGSPTVQFWILLKEDRVWQPETLSRVLELPHGNLPDGWELRQATYLHLDAIGQVIAVREMEGAGDGNTPEEQDPQSAQEWVMAMIWSEILGVNRVKRTDNFFLLGGHSLMAVRVLSRVNTLFHCNPSVKALFDHPTLEAFTRQVRAAAVRKP